MTRTRFCILAPTLAAGLLLAAATAGALTDREYLQGKLSFRYVDQPNTTNQNPDILDNAAIAGGTETGTFWTRGSVAGLQGLVRSLLKEPGHGGDANLQYVVAGVVRILDK